VLVASPATGQRPAVIIFPSFVGRSESEVAVARRLAGLGYVGIAADLYGEGRQGIGQEECFGLMRPFLEDRRSLQERLLAILEAVRALPEVDPQRVAAIGYCFGGLCALDLARSGADVSGVASFHGLFTPAPHLKGTSISAKVLAFHGWDDPMAPPEQVLELARELSGAGADWQIHAYGGTMHSFTNPNANAPEKGVMYNDTASQRSWATLERFLNELFG
jgi:dienelactone hydrolase